MISNKIQYNKKDLFKFGINLIVVILSTKFCVCHCQYNVTHSYLQLKILIKVYSKIADL